MSTYFTAEEFQKQLNTNYRVKLADNSTVNLELVEVKARVSDESEQQGLERFSAFFQGPAERQLPQQTYSFEHEKMGQLDIFIVPIAQNEQGFRYEAVFNFYK